MEDWNEDSNEGIMKMLIEKILGMRGFSITRRR
jgi:hypothetical protein